MRSGKPGPCQAGYNKSRAWGRAGRRGRRAGRGRLGAPGAGIGRPPPGGGAQQSSESNKRPARPAPAAHTSIEGSGASAIRPAARSFARSLARSLAAPRPLSSPRCRPRPAPPHRPRDQEPRKFVWRVRAGAEGAPAERRPHPRGPGRREGSAPSPGGGGEPEPAPPPPARHGRRGPQPAACARPPAAGDVAPPGRRLQLLPGAPATGVLQCRRR